MEKTQKIRSSILASTIALGLIMAFSIAGAQYDGERPFDGEKPAIEHSAEIIDNGVIVTITSESAEAVQHIIEKHENKADKLPEGVEIDMAVQDDGVVLTITSDDAEQVEKIQQRAENGPRKGKNKPERPFAGEIDKAVEQLDNGVVVTITSENEEAVAHILERQNEKREGKEGVDTQVTELANGVQLTITSDDAEIIEKIQNHSEKGPRHGRDGRNGKLGGPRGQ